MTEIKPYMCSCCEEIWNRENQKSIKLGKYELHLCPDCYHEYIISNNAVLDKISIEVEQEADYQDAYVNADVAKGMLLALSIIDKYRNKMR